MATPTKDQQGADPTVHNVDKKRMADAPQVTKLKFLPKSRMRMSIGIAERSILKFRHKQSLEEHMKMLQGGGQSAVEASDEKADSAEAMGDEAAVNDGGLQATMEQMFMGIMYGAFSGDLSDVPAPVNETIVPQLGLSGPRFSENVMKNLVNPENVEDYIDALAEFSQTADFTFDLAKGKSGDYSAARGDQLSQVWSYILSQSSSHNAADPEVYEKADELASYLWGPSYTNPITGQKISAPMTELYAGYIKAQKAYLQALTEYYEKEMNTNAAVWSKIAKIEQEKVQTARDDWTANGKEEVELIISEKAALFKGYTVAAIKDASALFEGADGTSKTYGKFYPVQMLPSDALSPSAASWTSYQLQKGTDYSSFKKTAQKYGGSTRYGYGLWSVGVDASHTKETFETDTETSNIAITMEYCRVELVRNWLSTSWMQAPDWYCGPNDPFTISKGTVAENAGRSDLTLSSYPTAFILARNIVVTAKFGQKQFKALSEASSGGASVSYCGFRVGGQASTSTFEASSSSSDTNGTIKCPDVQIIAYVVRTPPKSAPVLKDEK